MTHSFQNISPWTSLLLALSGDISLNPGPGSRSLNGCLLNVRSIRNKSASFLEFVKDNNADLIAVTETWLRPEDTESFISSITPPGYKFTHVPRNIKKGGGVGFFIKEDLSKIHKINISDFRMDILKSDLIRCPYKTASLLSHQYFNTLRSLLDKHAPIMKKNIPRHAETGFMNCDILKAKRLKRKYERAWRRENSASNRSRYRAAINHYNFLLEKSKCNHYSNIVAENQGNPKALWNCFKKILCCCST